MKDVGYTIKVSFYFIKVFKFNIFKAFLIYLFLLTGFSASAQESVSDILGDGLKLNLNKNRSKLVERLKKAEVFQRKINLAKAKMLGLPLTYKTQGNNTAHFKGFNGEKPLYYITQNVNSAKSIAVDSIQSAPYSLTGTGLTVGVWDAGSLRLTHQEFSGSRLRNMDAVTNDTHSMHVAGTIGAAGIVANAKGMATAVHIDSYDWNSDFSEITSRAATSPGQQATNLYLSNHSYGYLSGWENKKWWGNGTDQNGFEDDFGRYTSYTRNLDVIAYNATYYLGFWAAMNERSHNYSNGTTVYLSPSSTTPVIYDTAIHPPGDGKYRNGFECIGSLSIAKNIVTVGAVNDSVSNGQRDISKATLTSFSSWGPTDDGRIKPDIVANGASLYSTDDDSDSDYRTMSGTSMATPSACGAAALLVEHYSNLNNGGAMRSSTLKALIIHTADDIYNTGPDYKSGWGLMNTEKAAEIITEHDISPSLNRMTEDKVTSSLSVKNYSFAWDGESAIKATICWTDPAGSSTNSADSRTSRLVNDLNIRIIAPDSTEYYPFVMPFVGTWTVASMNAMATTGVNHTDNVEQIIINAPGQAGEWTVEVSFTGSLTNNEQEFGLILTGTADTNNNAPTFNSDPIYGTDAYESSSYTGSISGSATDIDGDSLSYSKLSGSAWLSVSSDGSLSGTPTNIDVGINMFTVKVNDTRGGTATTSLNINVINTENDAPVFTNNPFSTLNGFEDSAYSASIAESATDYDGDTLSYSKVSGSTWLNLSEDGTLSGTPSILDIGLNSFTIQVSDASGATDTAILNITVISTSGWTEVIDEDFESPDVSSYSQGVIPDNGNWVGSNTGFGSNKRGLTDKAGGDFNAIDPNDQGIAFRYTNSGLITNEGVIGALTDGVTYRVTFDAVRDDGLNAGTYYNIQLVVLGINDKRGDMSHGAVIASATGNAPNDGSFTTVTFELSADSATYATYIGSDLSLRLVGSTTSAIIDNVKLETFGGTTPPPSNQDPVFLSDPIVGSDAVEDSNYIGTIAGSATDADDNTLSYTKLSGPSWLSIASDGTLSGTPTNNDVGSNNFFIEVSDNNGGTDLTTLTINVINTNDAPLFSMNPIIATDATEGITYSGTIVGLAIDADSDTLSYTKTSGPNWLSIAFDGSLSGTPSNTNIGLNTFDVQVSDGNGGTDTTILNITVIGVNESPSFNADPVVLPNATEDQSFTDTLAPFANDPDSDTLEFSKLSGPAWLVIGLDGAVSGTPKNSDVGLNTFSIQVSDGNGELDTTTLNISVINVNDVPVFNINPITGIGATENIAYADSLAGSASDEDGDTLSYSKINGPSWLIIANDGSLSGTALSADVGLNVFTVQVSDGNGGVVSATLNISVDASSGATIIFSEDFENPDVTSFSQGTIPENGKWVGSNNKSGFGWNKKGITDKLSNDFSASDPNHQAMAFRYTNSGIITAAGILGNLDDGMTYKITFDAVKDNGKNAGTPYNVQLVVLNTQDNRGDMKVGTILANAIGNAPSDGSFSTITFELTGDTATHGSLIGSDLSLRLIGASTSAIIDNVVVETLSGLAPPPANQKPIFTLDPITGSNANENQAYIGTINGSATDADDDALTYSKVSGPTWLSIATNGNLSGTPLTNHIGFNSFVIQVADENGGTATANLNITVLNVNDAPVFIVNPITVTDAQEGVVYTGSIAGLATDADNDNLTYSNLSGASWLNIDSDGTLTGTPSSSDVGLNLLSIQVADGQGGSDIAILEIIVNAVTGFTTVLNEDFESPDVSIYTKGMLPDNDKWVGSNNNSGYGWDKKGVTDKSSNDFSATDPNNQAMAFRYTNSGIITAAGVIGNVTDTVTYKVTFDGVRDDGLNAGTAYNVQLVVLGVDDDRGNMKAGTVLANAVGNASSDGSFTTVTFEITIDSSIHADYLGSDLGLRLVGATTSAIIDNVIVQTSSN